MNPYSSGPGAPPPPSTNANDTRRFPQGEVPASMPGVAAPQASPSPAYAPVEPESATGGGGAGGRAGHGGHPYPPWAGNAQGWRQARERDRTTLGLILIGGGLLFLLGQFPFFGNFGEYVPLFIGMIFMYAYFATRQGHRIGFLIPGSILLGVGAAKVVSNLPSVGALTGGDESFVAPVMLGLGFCLIWFLERRQRWALIPGGILIIIGLFKALLLETLWPLLLIGLGVYVLYDQMRRRG